ncbi:PLP-dependent transferase [Aspergillus mulundensis]|uniref:PLP-dependent transferase n=1 Tax=Aspergillus mulundensis TaxID=1810919 RepID=A0A3D8T4B8_9EURO|nr:PLP-dependent transferase [Aspergillus mulundensis]RDW93369.1 PLP-dependent transferase [Aspergillus mulundensis]
MGSIGTGPVDLSHHINRKSKARHPSPLKDIIKFMGQDGMISLAGGLPHPSLFPLHGARFDCLPPSSSMPDVDNGDLADDLISLTLGRGSNPGDLDLTQFLQYGTTPPSHPKSDESNCAISGSGTGNKQLLTLCKELTDVVHSPPCEYECLLHPGNTNAWAKVVGMLCEDDDFVLVEEYTYPSAQALWIPLGVRAVPVSADAQGISASVLRDTLAGWDGEARGARRPRVLYLVAVGSNPTGLSISTERRKEIYDVCVEFGTHPKPQASVPNRPNESIDIILVEDDPYYFLQYPSYNPSHTTQEFTPLSTPTFLQTLTPSFLSLDTQGRVIRLESFSKTLFPGLRLGYFIANPLFTERLLRATEVETQDPAGLSQAFILALLRKWGVDGYLQWLQRLQEEYRVRRDWLVRAFYKSFVVLPAAESPLPNAEGFVACLESATGLKPVFSFIDPEAGMFVWSKWYFSGVKRFSVLSSDSGNVDPEQMFATELWEALAAELVLLTPGSYYHPWQGGDKVSTRERGAEEGTAHFRFSFATPTEEQIGLAVERVRRVVERFWV